MKIIGIVFGLLLLAGCQTSPSSQTQETVSPTDYQACIQAAKSGNGAESEAKCERVMDDTR
ncbi:MULTISPECIES: ChiQ/YbfN family lipoprotein [Lelliottia]|jgi:uncharacterized lipoprotein YajG|uniref:EexN family lipoprotein n=1 Tax=Lelliottia aquatilis TaxID=2080838 RepID=A0ABX4ZVS8_9ENTR|nr:MULTISPECIES: ChiQ/YbfN family lipoprotein [Lelliottia]ASV56451.1 hypothetical protein LJPFL01_3088 [Lelliottia jeotgali]MBL5883369.1 hypothetical protein [Lelliottia aquatilis]NTZ48659.1 hypothetical protein [Lelliottia aquatilis]POZ14625.1 hypothetical protein C3708_23285 [Lelliottia sp. 7254-16]POZ15781.1 hypothetical protein C3Z09_12880 [Lelliottia aquatilis]